MLRSLDVTHHIEQPRNKQSLIYAILSWNIINMCT